MDDGGSGGGLHRRLALPIDSHFEMDERRNGSSSPQAPIFVLCGARSGSTLLRYVLDAHPEIACPAELNLAEVFVQLTRVHSMLAMASVREAPVSAAGLSAAGTASCRAFASSTIGRLARERGKSRWADKSLVNAALAELLFGVFPEAQFVCLFRECADFIVSADEASPWGLSGYGFEPYARESPANSVLALARYWVDHTESMLNFLDAHPQSSHRIRYEDLVSEPRATLRAAFDFLDLLDHQAPSNEAIFHRRHRGFGPQDHKIEFTEFFDPSSIGQGWRAPLELIPPPLVERINRLAERLGYQQLGGQLEAAVLGLGTDVPVGSTWPAERADELNAAIDRTLNAFFASEQPYGHLSSMKLLVPDTGGCWVIDFKKCEVRPTRETCKSAVIAEAGAMEAILGGEVNPAALVRRGGLRAVGPADAEDTGLPQRHLDAFLFELRGALVPRPCVSVGTPQLVEVLS